MEKDRMERGREGEEKERAAHQVSNGYCCQLEKEKKFSRTTTTTGDRGAVTVIGTNIGE